MLLLPLTAGLDKWELRNLLAISVTQIPFG